VCVVCGGVYRFWFWLGWRERRGEKDSEPDRETLERRKLCGALVNSGRRVGGVEVNPPKECECENEEMEAELGDDVGEYPCENISPSPSSSTALHP
jgi:hypothetical protein